jgi:O-antigen/teichoic acid export membrane protein
MQLVAATSFFVTARFYGVTGRGMYASATSIVTFACSLVGLSVGMVLPYFVVNARVEREQFFKKNLFTVAGLIFALSAVAGLSVAIAWRVHPHLFGKLPPSFIAAVGVSLPYYMWTGSNDVIFSAAGQIVEQNRIAFINRSVFLISSTALVAFGGISLLSYLIVYGAFNLAQMAHELGFLVKKFNADFAFDPDLGRDIVRKGIAAHPVTIAGLLNTTFSILVLNYYSTDLKDVGYFNFASQLATMLMVLPIVVNRYLMSEITEHGVHAVWAKQKRAMAYCLVTMAAVCGLAALLIVPFCHLFKREFTGAITLFRLFLFVVLPSSFCTLLQSQWYSSGLFKVMSIANIAVGLMSASITLFSVPRFHEFGAVTTTIITSLALFGINLVFYRKLDRDAARLSAMPDTEAA